MSFKNPINIIESSSQELQIFPRKRHKQISPLIKLQIINALDNGQCKIDIAKKFSVNPQTISNMYRKKDSILHKYTQTYNALVKDARSVNLDKFLLEWFRLQTLNRKNINSEQLNTKALSFARSLNEEPSWIYTKEWLHDFRLRHNIIAFKSNIKCSQSAREEWLNFLNIENVENIYIGAVCSLTYKYDLKNYVNGQDIENSACLFLVTNAAGTDKKQLAVVGQEVLHENVSSLPVSYYNGTQPQMNHFVLSNYLRKWDMELKANKKTIFLLLNVPINFIRHTCFENIRILNLINFMYVLKASEKIVECFKFHFRTLLINKTILQNYEASQIPMADYVHLMSLAWYNVSCRYIRLLFSPPEDGSLYFKIEYDDDGDHSLTRWCKEHNIDLDLINVSSNTLDKYIMCDEKVPCFNLEQSGNVFNTREIIFDKNMNSSSAIEAYQAMRRLISYIQGKGADDVLLHQAKLLEEQLECASIMELYQITDFN